MLHLVVQNILARNPGMWRSALAKLPKWVCQLESDGKRNKDTWNSKAHLVVLLKYWILLRKFPKPPTICYHRHSWEKMKSYNSILKSQDNSDPTTVLSYIYYICIYSSRIFMKLKQIKKKYSFIFGLIHPLSAHLKSTYNTTDTTQS